MATGFEFGPGWWVLLLGWPAILGAFVAFSLAVARKSRLPAIFGCLLVAPMFLYLSAAPRFLWLAPAAFVLLCLLAWRVEKSGWITNCLLALPAVTILAWLGYAVVTQ
jgi:hypothetical protein